MVRLLPAWSAGGSGGSSFASTTQPGGTAGARRGDQLQAVRNKLAAARTALRRKRDLVCAQLQRQAVHRVLLAETGERADHRADEATRLSQPPRGCRVGRQSPPARVRDRRASALHAPTASQTKPVSPATCTMATTSPCGGAAGASTGGTLASIMGGGLVAAAQHTNKPGSAWGDNHGGGAGECQMLTRRESRAASRANSSAS